MKWTGTARLIGATLAVGIGSGLGAVAFHFLSDRLAEILFAWAGSRIFWLPTVGLLLIGLALHNFPESRAGGVREVIESLRQGGLVPMVRIWNVILSGLVLAVGGSVGPEGPMVQLGALIGSQCGQRFGVTRQQLTTMVRAGASAGIAAAFRSPAGGVLLTLEIFGARFDRDLTAITIAAGIGYLVRTSMLADAFPFRPAVTLEPLPNSTLLWIVPAMGALAAFAGHFFIGLFERCKTVLPLTWPLWIRVTLGGAMVGLIGIWYPQVLSAGYPTIAEGLNTGFGVDVFVILLFLKMLATSITFGSGAVGGLFAPTLVIGSLFGGAVGYGMNAIAPSAVPQPALFVLLGMIVMFGSIVKGYWSGLLMIADLSGCYHQLLLPGVIAGGISCLIGWELRDRSIFGLTLDSTGSTRA